VRDDLVLTTLTDEGGRFVLDEMTPGTWKMTATMFGFETVRRDVQIGAIPAAIDFTLQLRRAGELPQRGAELSIPPGAGRNPSNGVGTPDCPMIADACVSAPGKTDDTDEPLLLNGSLSKSLKTKHADFASESRSQVRDQQGRTPNELIGNRTKAEGDRLHWSGFYEPGNSMLNAAPFSLNGQKNAKPATRQDLFGFNAAWGMKGSRLLHVERILWFASYNANPRRTGSSLATTVPTPEERGGNFTGVGYTVYDPAGGTPFPANHVPTLRISPIAQGLMQYIPAPNQPGTVQNFVLTTSTPNNSQTLSARSAMTLFRGDQIGVAFNWQGTNARVAQAYGALDRVYGNSLGASIDWRRTLGARIFNTLTVSFNRNISSTIPKFANGPDVAAQLGIEGTSPNPLSYGPPNLNFTNFGALADGSPSQSEISYAGVSEQLSLISGEHAWSFGGGYSRFFNNTATDANGRGTFTFTGLATGLPSANGQTLAGAGFDFADFLLGLPDASSISYGSSATYFRSISYFVFVQDDYHVGPNMTLNLGLRYDYFSPWQEKYGRMSNLAIGPDFAGATVVTPAMPGEPPGLIRSDRNNFAPRTALAWKPSERSRMTVRMGYAWHYDPGVYNQFRARLAVQTPFAVTRLVNTSVDNMLTLGTGLKATPAGTVVASTFAVKQDYRDMYGQTWNVSVQSGLPGALTGEVAYIGTKGTRLDVQGTLQQAPRGSLIGGNAGGFIYDTPDGNSVYHAGQAHLARRFHDGVSVSLTYTYAKSIDNSSLLGGAGNTIAQNIYDLRAERGLSSFDRRHTLMSSFVWTSPFGEGGQLPANSGWIIPKALKDWTISGNMTLESGIPLTAQIVGNQFDPAGTGTLSTSRASATGLPVNTGIGFFNLQAFAVPAPGQFGNAGRNTIPGPGLFSMNLSLQRNIRIGERKQLQIRVDSTNVTNHVNIVGVGTVVNALTYGVPSAAGGMRTLTSHLGFNF
jgi:hypothetical protein